MPGLLNLKRGPLDTARTILKGPLLVFGYPACFPTSHCIGNLVIQTSFGKPALSLSQFRWFRWNPPQPTQRRNDLGLHQSVDSVSRVIVIRYIRPINVKCSPFVCKTWTRQMDSITLSICNFFKMVGFFVFFSLLF